MHRCAHGGKGSKGSKGGKGGKGADHIYSVGPIHVMYDIDRRQVCVGPREHDARSVDRHLMQSQLPGIGSRGGIQWAGGRMGCSGQEVGMGSRDGCQGWDPMGFDETNLLRCVRAGSDVAYVRLIRILELQLARVGGVGGGGGQVWDWGVGLGCGVGNPSQVWDWGVVWRLWREFLPLSPPPLSPVPLSPVPLSPLPLS